MPIRLNLLAEAQVAEDQRRRDPVKRVLWMGALLVALMLVWASSLQLKAMLAHNDLTGVETQMNTHTNEYQQVLDNRKKLNETNVKLAALRQLATNRFLNGNLLNTLQQATAEDVQLAHLRVDQQYIFTEEVKARTNGSRTLPRTPATQTEKIMIVLDGSDSSPAFDQYNKFKETLSGHPYFQSFLGKTNQITLRSISQPQIASENGRPCVLFTLECRYPEKVR